MGDLVAKLWNGLVIAFVTISLGIGVVIYGALTPYGYWVGVPAKATVDHCQLHGAVGPDSSPDLRCIGTWTSRGQSQTGPIKPPFREDEQNGIRAGKSVLDVRVHDGTAYTPLSVGKSFYVSLAAGTGLLGWGCFRLWKLRRRPAT